MTKKKWIILISIIVVIILGIAAYGYYRYYNDKYEAYEACVASCEKYRMMTNCIYTSSCDEVCLNPLKASWC